MNKLLISALLGMVVSSNTYADVTVNIDRNLHILAVNGVEPEISFGHTDEMTLPNGLNQLLVRLEKVIHFGGTQNKYKSPSMVISFNADNESIFLKPGSVVRDEATAKTFDKKPAVILTNSSMQPIEFKQDVLVAKGFSVFRDYENELYNYNSQGKIASISILNNVGINRKRSEIVSEPAKTAQTAQDAMVKSQATIQSVSKSYEMVQYWFGEANATERKEFANWAFVNRSEVTQAMATQSKPVEMMAYWYEKADKTEKSTILSWLISQE